MAERYLELAALAVSACTGLAVTGTAEYSYGTRGDFDAALLRLGDGGLAIARSPRSAAAAREQRAEIRADAALTAGVRSLLPFGVPRMLGSRDDEEARVMVTAFLPGEKLDRLAPGADDPLLAEAGRALAAIHALPRVFVDEARLPALSAEEAREGALRDVESARATGRLPASIERRWRDAVRDPSLWQFAPCVIHGSMSPARIVSDGRGVTGVLGWSDVRVGDPARDMHWLHRQEPAAADAVLAAYTASRGASVDRQLRRRAGLYAELEVARWLAHGARSGQEGIVADAEDMLLALADRVRHDETGPVVHETLPVLDLTEVRLLLREAEEAGAPGPAVQDGLVHGDEGQEHPDDLSEHDLDHAEDDDLGDDTPPEDFLRR
ncbi:MAG: phosphotransferase [Pseudoclavibacter sp.]|nr:phosphotransferase [Pseudoclavibacter sp.]